MEQNPFHIASANPTVCVAIACNSGGLEGRCKQWRILFEIPLQIANSFTPLPYRWLLLYTCHILGVPESAGRFTHFPDDSHNTSENAISINEISISPTRADLSVERLLQGPVASAPETSYLFLQVDPRSYNFLPPNLLTLRGRAETNASSGASANSTVSSGSRQSERNAYIRSRTLLRDNGDPLDRLNFLLVHPHIETLPKITSKRAKDAKTNSGNGDFDWKRIERCLTALPPTYEVQLNEAGVNHMQSLKAAHLFPFAGNSEDFLYLAHVRGQPSAEEMFCMNDRQNVIIMESTVHENYDGGNDKPTFVFMPVPASFRDWPLPQDESGLTFPQTLKDNPGGRPVFFVVHHFAIASPRPRHNAVGVFGDSPVASLFAGPPKWLLEYIAGARFLLKFGKRTLWEYGYLKAAEKPSEEILSPLRQAMQAAEISAAHRSPSSVSSSGRSSSSARSGAKRTSQGRQTSAHNVLYAPDQSADLAALDEGYAEVKVAPEAKAFHKVAEAANIQKRVEAWRASVLSDCPDIGIEDSFSA